jgi:hypothetical protein
MISHAFWCQIGFEQDWFGRAAAGRIVRFLVRGARLMFFVIRSPNAQGKHERSSREAS